jgi:nucleoid-associated protein YgaU
MGLQDKYKAVIDVAKQSGARDLVVEEKNNVLHVTAKASEKVKQKMWDAYGRIDPDMRAGDLMMNIEAADFDEMYEVKEGDSLSKIAKQYGTTWQEIHAMNKDVVKNPDKIFPGQKIKIPKS